MPVVDAWRGATTDVARVRFVGATRQPHDEGGGWLIEEDRIASSHVRLPDTGLEEDGVAFFRIAVVAAKRRFAPILFSFAYVSDAAVAWACVALDVTPRAVVDQLSDLAARYDELDGQATGLMVPLPGGTWKARFTGMNVGQGDTRPTLHLGGFRPARRSRALRRRCRAPERPVRQRDAVARVRPGSDIRPPRRR